MHFNLWLSQSISSECPVVLLADIDDVKTLALAIGVATLVGGILLLLHHKRELDAVLASDKPDRVAAWSMVGNIASSANISNTTSSTASMLRCRRA